MNVSNEGKALKDWLGAVRLDVVSAADVSYRPIKRLSFFTTRLAQNLCRVPPRTVLAVHHFDAARAVKITMKRWIASGNVGDTDVYGAQQHAPLLSLRVPGLRG